MCKYSLGRTAQFHKELWKRNSPWQSVNTKSPLKISWKHGGYVLYNIVNFSSRAFLLYFRNTHRVPTCPLHSLAHYTPWASEIQCKQTKSHRTHFNEKHNYTTNHHDSNYSLCTKSFENISENHEMCANVRVHCALLWEKMLNFTLTKQK